MPTTRNAASKVPLVTRTPKPPDWLLFADDPYFVALVGRGYTARQVVVAWNEAAFTDDILKLSTAKRAVRYLRTGIPPIGSRLAAEKDAAWITTAKHALNAATDDTIPIHAPDAETAATVKQSAFVTHPSISLVTTPRSSSDVPIKTGKHPETTDADEGPLVEPTEAELEAQDGWFRRLFAKLKPKRDDYGVVADTEGATISEERAREAVRRAMEQPHALGVPGRIAWLIENAPQEWKDDDPTHGAMVREIIEAELSEAYRAKRHAYFAAADEEVINGTGEPDNIRGVLPMPDPAADFFDTPLPTAELPIGFARKDAPQPDPAAPGPHIVLTEREDGTAILESPKGRITTLEQLIAAADIDLAIWTVERWVANKWESAAKGSDGEVTVTPLFQVKAWLKRSTEAVNLIELKGRIIADMTAHAPVYAPRAYPVMPEAARHLLEVSPFDLHLGKLAWGREVDGANYDSRAAKDILLWAVDDALEKAAGFPIERILFPVGNDLLHTDNPENLTARGTRQDADSRHKKMFQRAYELMVTAIDHLQTVAPVDVVIVPGNHDTDAAFKLGEVLYAWYRNCEAVTVDNAPTMRKYYRYGTTLLGLTHGNEEKHGDLPLIMARERADDWAATTHHEWHTGHLHKRKQTNYIAGDTNHGVVIRILPALCGTDAWHHAKGYVKGPRAMESYLYEHATGYAGHFSSNYHEPTKG
jgi:hypothetical protein